MRPSKTSHLFQIAGKTVKFSSNFDSGNLRTVTQLSSCQFLVQSSLDSYQIPVSSKSFFHFSVQNYPLNKQLIVKIPSLALIQSLYNYNKEQKLKNLKKYTPWYSINGQDYLRVSKDNISFLQQNQSIPILKIKHIVETTIVYFSFALPYTYERYLNCIRDLPESDKFYIRKDVLCYSLNLNLVYMLTITSFDRISEEEENIGQETNGVILPQKHLKSRGKYFDKPVLLISGRVHPGQTPSSWAIQGIIKFVTGSTQQAQILRKYFLIIIVPMLNPDGVYEGLYRLDTMGHNLNRYYQVSDNRQPSIYGMKHLIKHYQTTKRLLYFLDFHGHPSLKGSFIYGNAIDDIAYQSETQLFAKLLSLKCRTFQQKFCIFQRQQMKSKDRYDFFTKEGCARVYAFKTAGILHSYTIQMGFHSCTQFNDLENDHQNFLYGQKDYQTEGIAVLKCVLQSCDLTKSISNKHHLRKKIAANLDSRQDRFRKQSKNLNKQQYWKSIKLRFFNNIKFIQKSSSKKHRNLKLVSLTQPKSNQASTKPFPLSCQNIQQKINELQIKYQQFKHLNSLSIEKPQKHSHSQFSKDNKKQIQMKNITFSMKKDNKNYQKFHSTQKNRLYLKIMNRQQQNRKISAIKQIRAGNYQKLSSSNKKSQIRIIKRQQSLKDNQMKIQRKFFNLREEEVMFNDVRLREEEKAKTISSEYNPKSKFSVVPDSTISINLQEFKDVFKLQTNKGFQLSHRRSMKTKNLCLGYNK